MRRAALLFVLALSQSACSSSQTSGSGLDVVATTTQVGDLVRQVGGDHAQVTQILHSGSDPHEYEPRPSDALAVSRADVVFSSGGDVDSWLDGVLKQAGGSARHVTLIDSVPREGDDPHWWQDVTNAERAVTAIRDALVAKDPRHAAAYRRNAGAYERRLHALDAGIRRCVAGLPRARRKLVTSHDALGYYAHRYGFTVIGAAIPSLSSQAEPSAGSTQRLVQQIRAQHVPAIFPETALNPKL